jgi:hypothetical protein
MPFFALSAAHHALLCTQCCPSCSSLQKIERLKSTLHLIGLDCGNTHTLFVDDAEDVDTFDAASHFDTHEDVLQRAANRPRMRTMMGEVCSGICKKTVDQVLYRAAPTDTSASASLCHFRSTKNGMHRTCLQRSRPRAVDSCDRAPLLSCVTVLPADTGS